MWSHFPPPPPPPSFRCSIPHRTFEHRSAALSFDEMSSATVLCCGLLATSFSFTSRFTFPVTRVWGCSRCLSTSCDNLKGLGTSRWTTTTDFSAVVMLGMGPRHPAVAAMRLCDHPRTPRGCRAQPHGPQGLGSGTTPRAIAVHTSTTVPDRNSCSNGVW